ncbi:poly(A) RNA polymerase GLD2-like [Montipora foliosa]|uniref:poly(A) RNA polymerase GLD2-like n=1 Tax=Montipora foliosa TaxID=591990 RepID=UPI0035F209AC
MANTNKHGRLRYYHAPSLHDPSFHELNRYTCIPPLLGNNNLSSISRQHPKTVTFTSVQKPFNKKEIEVIDLTKSPPTRASTATISTPVESTTTNFRPVESTATISTPVESNKTIFTNVERSSSKFVDFREQRTLSASSGEVLYHTSGQKRPAKRRHHSSALPGFHDDVPVQQKRARQNNYSTPATNSRRLNPYDTPPPVFTINTLSVEIQEECENSLQSQELLQTKLKLKSFLEESFSKTFPDCSLHLTGSSGNGFGGNRSDADFCLILKNLRQANVRREALIVLQKMHKMIMRDPTFCFLRNCTVVPATVPILKFFDTRSGCECDININNTVGVRNTHLLRAYCGVDHRVQPLVVIVKKWAKNHGINDASQGTLSSYALTLMVIHYLQGVCKPAVVPVLQKKYPKLFRFPEEMSDLSQQDPCKDIACNMSENRQSLGELLVGFFKYYAEDFRWDDHYISIAMGAAFRNGQWQRKLIFIEEPFDGNNVAKAVCSRASFDNIQMKFRLAWLTLRMSPSLESIKVK